MVTIALCNKDTQPSQTCSKGYTFSEPPPEGGLDLVINRKGALFLLLYCTGVFLCFWGVLTRLEYELQKAI